MLLNWYSIIKRDKNIEHSKLGNISCQGLYDSFKKCNELLSTPRKINVQCRSLYEITMKCFRCKDEREFTNWIDDQIDERKRLYQFLIKNDSVIPLLQRKYMVSDIIINTVDEEVKTDDSIIEDYKKQTKQNMQFIMENKDNKQQ